MGYGFEELNCLNCKDDHLNNILYIKKQNNNEISNGDVTLKDEFYNYIKNLEDETSSKPKINLIKNLKTPNKKKNFSFLDETGFSNLLCDIEEFSSLDDDELKIQKIPNFIIDNTKKINNFKYLDKNNIDRYNDSTTFVSINKNYRDSFDTTKINTLYSESNGIKDLDNEQLNSASKNLITTSKSSKISKRNVFDLDMHKKLKNIRKDRESYFRCLQEYFLDKNSDKSQIFTKKFVNNNLSTDFRIMYIKKKINDVFSVNKSRSNVISEINNKNVRKSCDYSKTYDDEEKADKNYNNKLILSIDNQIKEKNYSFIEFNKKNILNNEIYSNLRKIKMQNKK